MQKNCLLTLGVGLLLVTGGAFAQTTPKPSFEVASIKPAAPLDMQKLAAAVQSGGEMPKIGPRIDGSQAEYTYMALRELITMAYKVKPFQISGPDWLATQRFDIIAKMPAGSTKDDAPLMLQSLLEERFKMTVHKDSKEHQVLALVVGKGGPKLKESEEKPKPIDESVPLKPGQIKMDTAEGPMRMTIDTKTGGATVDMGAKGKYTYKVDPSTMTMHMDADMVTMSGFADMLTQFSQMTGGQGPQVVDQTDLKGNYKVAFDFSLADLLAMARAAGMDVPGGAPGGAAGNTAGVAASDPGGGTSLRDAVTSLGLKLEGRKLPVEQLVIDHIEKTPTAN